ncbi:MAG: efflux RND transporter periplasmic adaptor subunit [bacterium]
MNRKIRFTLLIIFALLIAAAAGCGRGKEKTVSTAEVRETEGYPVEVVVASVKSVNRKVHFTGTVRLPDVVSVIPQVPGIAKEIYADKGDEVHPGTPLMLVDPTDYKNNVSQAEAAVEMAKVQLEITQKGKDAKDWTQAANMKDAARAAYEYDKWNLERMEKLKDAGLVSEQQLVGAKTKAMASFKQFENAEIQSTIADEATKELQVRAARAQLQQAEAGLSMAKTALARTVVRSEVEGVVSFRMKSLGDFVGPGDSAFQIIFAGDKKLSFMVNENELPFVKEGQVANFTTTALPGRVFKAEVNYVATFVMDMNREATVEAIITSDIASETSDLRDGMFVEGDITLSPEDLLVIPYRAILENEIVWVAGKDKTSEKRICKKFSRVDDYIAIDNGCIRPGDKVIAKGQNLLSEGKKLKVLSETDEF